MKCKWENCEKDSVGKSKYCSKHKVEARQKWLSNIQDQQDQKKERYKQFKEIVKKAHQAGCSAAQAAQPVPMVVHQHENVLDDYSPIQQSWNVSEGVCGFAWINVSPGNTSFSHYLKKNHGAQKSYYGGLEIWVSEYGQSMTRKEAYASAFANVLHENKEFTKTKAYSNSRMD